MTKILGLHPEQLADNVWVIPGQGAINSPAPYAGYQTNPAVNGIPPATKIRYDLNPRIAHRRTPKSRGMTHFDYAGRNVAARNYWRFNTFPNQSLEVPLSTYSMRFYYTPYSNDAWHEAFPHLVTFMNGGAAGVDRFSLMQDMYRNVSGYYLVLRPFLKGPTNADNYQIPSALPFGFQMVASMTWRIEILVQPTAPKVTVNIYEWNSTTVWRTLTANPPEVSADTFMFGRHPSKCGGGLFIPEFWIGDVELFNTYNLDGTAGQHAPTPHNTWFEMVDGVEVPVNEVGTMSGGTLNTADRHNWNDHSREFIFASSNYTVHNFFYDNVSRPIRNATLYIPNGTPPSGGWPLVSFWHGGFYAAGNKADVDMNWVRWLLYNGFAVSTGEWIVGRAMINNPFAIGTWPNANSGRFPSFVIDPKLFALYMTQKGTSGDNTYPINTELMCITGHSAGGGIALMAGVSRDLVLNGRDLTVNNPLYGYRTATPDPEFKCIYVYSPPTDMKWAFDNDPTHPTFGVANQGQGVIRATANTYMGFAWNNNLTDAQMLGARTTEMIAAQDVDKIPPIGVVTASNDMVVPYQHTELLVAACAARGIDVDQIITKKDHDFSYKQGPSRHFMNFLLANGMKG